MNRLVPSKGDGSGASFLFVKQLFFYSHNNLLEVVAYFFVLKANNSVAFSFHKFCTHLVVLLLYWLVVITTIDFNDKFSFQTKEICDIVAYWMLSSEMVSTIEISQCFPQHRFTFCHLLSVSFCEILQQFIPVRSTCLKPFAYHHTESIYSPLQSERGWG